MPTLWKTLLNTLVLTPILFLCSQSSAASSKDNEFFKPYQKYLATDKVVVMPLNDNGFLYTNEIATLNDIIKVGLKPLANKVRYVKFEAQDDIHIYRTTTGYSTGYTPKAGDGRAMYAQQILSGFDIVVYPSVVMKPAKMDGRFIKKDGVKFAIEGDNNISSSTSIDWSGQQAIYSLELMIYDTKGNWLATTYGGIAMPKYARFDTKRFVRKDNIFGTEKRLGYLDKGIRIALKPILKKLRKK